MVSPFPRRAVFLAVAGVGTSIALALALRRRRRRTRVLVTGGTGYIAQFILDALLADGRFDVMYSYRGDAPPAALAPLARRGAVSVGPLDLTDGASCARALAAARADVLVHAAAESNLGACAHDAARARATNAPAATLLRAAADARAAPPPAVVYLSTDQVFGGDAGAPHAEEASADAAARPGGPADGAVNAYGASKRAFERALLGVGAPRALAAPCCVLRLSNVLGPRAPCTRAGKFLQFLDDRLREAARAGGAAGGAAPLTLFTDEVRSFVYVGDVARAVRACCARGRGARLPPVVHVGGPEPLNRLELGARVAAARGLGDLAALGVSAASRAALDEKLGFRSPRDITMKIGALRDELGVEPTPIDETLRLSLE